MLYNYFISDFETKINLLKFAHFAVVVSRQYSDKDAGISYLEGVILKLHDTQEARIEEPILYVKMQITTFLLEKGSKKECKKLLEEGKTTLDSMVDVDPTVHATYYWYVLSTTNPVKTTLNSTRVLSVIFNTQQWSHFQNHSNRTWRLTSCCFVGRKHLQLRRVACPSNYP